MSENDNDDTTRQDPDEICLPGPSSSNVDTKKSEMLETWKELTKTSLRNIKKVENSLRNISELETLNPSTDNVLKDSLQDFVASFQLLQNHMKNMIAYNSAGNKEAPFAPPLDISLTVASSEIPQQSISPLDDKLSITPLENQESPHGVSLPVAGAEKLQTVSSEDVDSSDNGQNPQSSTSQMEEEEPHRNLPSQTVLDPSQSSPKTSSHKYNLRPRAITVSEQITSTSKPSEREKGRCSLIPSTTARNVPSIQEYNTSSKSESLEVTTSSDSCQSLPSTPAVQYAISVSPTPSTEQTSNFSTSLAQFFATKYYHLLRDQFKLAVERLKSPIFPSECIEIQTILISLFLHLLNELEEFIDFVEGKQMICFAEVSPIEKLTFVKGNFSSIEKTKQIRGTIGNYERRIKSLKPDGLDAVESLLGDLSVLAPPTLATSMNSLAKSSIPFRNLVRKDEVSQDLFDFIIGLNEQVVSLLCSCRDTTRSIVDYCYQTKLSLHDGILHAFLNYLLWMATWFMKLRQQYTNSMNDGTTVTTLKLLKVKTTVAFQLKKLALSVLDKNSRFWDLIGH